MQRGKTLFTKITAAVAISGLFALGAVPPISFAKDRGKSGLPPGPGNPIARLYDEILDLKQRVEDVENTAPQPATMWINHLDLVPGDSDVSTSFNVANSGLNVGSVMTGAKFVEKGLQVPPGYTVTAVRVCYEYNSGSISSINQIRLAQVQEPLNGLTTILDDTTVQGSGPTCVDSTLTSVDPSLGTVLLRLGFDFGQTTDMIIVRALGLHLTPTVAP